MTLFSTAFISVIRGYDKENSKCRKKRVEMLETLLRGAV